MQHLHIFINVFYSTYVCSKKILSYNSALGRSFSVKILWFFMQRWFVWHRSHTSDEWKIAKLCIYTYLNMFNPFLMFIFELGQFYVCQSRYEVWGYVGSYRSPQIPPIRGQEVLDRRMYIESEETVFVNCNPSVSRRQVRVVYPM